MDPMAKVMTKGKLTALNEALANMQRVYAECERAEKAGVPGLDGVKQECIDISNRIALLKATYFSTSI